MTTKEKSVALQALNDMQRMIEEKETEWTKAFNDGEPTEKIDSEIDRLLHIRNGMEMILNELGINVGRKDYRSAPAYHTVWYLS